MIDLTFFKAETNAYIGVFSLAFIVDLNIMQSRHSQNAAESLHCKIDFEAQGVIN